MTLPSGPRIGEAKILLAVLVISLIVVAVTWVITASTAAVPG